MHAGISSTAYYIKVAVDQPGDGSKEYNSPPPAKFVKVSDPPSSGGESAEEGAKLPSVGMYNYIAAFMIGHFQTFFGSIASYELIVYELD